MVEKGDGWKAFETLRGTPNRKETDMPHMHDQTRGLYNKFEIRRVDGSSEPGEKHHSCEYFVLDLVHDKHAAAALRAYAESCVDEYPQLAADLLKKLPE